MATTPLTETSTLKSPMKVPWLSPARLERAVTTTKPRGSPSYATARTPRTPSGAGET